MCLILAIFGFTTISFFRRDPNLNEAKLVPPAAPPTGRDLHEPKSIDSVFRYHEASTRPFQTLPTQSSWIWQQDNPCCCRQKTSLAS